MTQRRPFAFFVVLAIVSVPFFLYGASGRQLLPGLPVSALAAVCPFLAAAILLVVDQGRDGVWMLAKRSLDFRRIPARWYIPILLTMPAVFALSYGVMILAGRHIPAPQIALAPALAMALVFLFAALGEELGWTGYALEPLQTRFGSFGAALLIGVIWAAWHFIPLAQAQRSIEWIAWWSLETLAIRFVMVWLYNRAGRSVFAIALFHASDNLCWQIAPNLVNSYDPRVFGPVMAAVAAAILLFGSRRAGLPG